MVIFSAIVLAAGYQTGNSQPWQLLIRNQDVHKWHWTFHLQKREDHHFELDGGVLILWQSWSKQGYIQLLRLQVRGISFVTLPSHLIMQLTTIQLSYPQLHPPPPPFCYMFTIFNSHEHICTCKRCMMYQLGFEPKSITSTSYCTSCYQSVQSHCHRRINQQYQNAPLKTYILVKGFSIIP